ncbi:pullulanase-type alpha-1,6-glucosidase [Bowmanella sp. Y26]|uniref:pullulanase-type alpha-1,6-glucosidase n=1 Tax=Bowmanella yangjiangensis TaxID=2811230 RepID=UPI001BDD4158|nr:pullulanase-type alpha-1,6-glucosidase [Bowmanella yangjiangensis]MBT1065284.1 pullulanase-type alpha-1,6-glucosidase [Bowmanella yangjiangensis]
MKTRLIGFLLCVLSLPVLAQWQIQSQAHFSYATKPLFDRVNRQYVSQVTLTNQGTELISGPMRVLIENTSHSILNSSGEVEGKPYIDLNVNSLAAGQSTEFSIQLALSRVPLALTLALQSQAIGTGLVLGEHQIAIFYQRDDQDYNGWGLHLWNGEGCGNYAAPTTDAPYFNNWSTPYPADGIHPDYGAYYILNIEPGANCYNFIIHKGNDKALGPDNSRFEPQKGNQAFTFDGYPEIWYQPIIQRPLFLDGARAHWQATDTLLWATDDAAEYRLYYSHSANLSPLDTSILANLAFIPLQPATVSPQFYQQDPHLGGFKGFNLSVTDAQAKSLIKAQLVAVALDNTGNLVDITRVQIGRLLDHLYTRNEADADESALGLTYAGDQVTVSVWAPTARQLSLQVFDQAKSLLNSHEMHKDEHTGIWTYSANKASLDRHFYRFEIEVFHPATDAIETLIATDPYSVSLSTNGQYSQFVNLEDNDLKPNNWDGHMVPEVSVPEANVIYETHIRDFSIWDESVSQQNRGKYLAFTEINSQSVQHLQRLQQAGLTHIHLLPANDIASIEEDSSQRVDINDSVGRLCQFNANAPVCGVEDPNRSLLEVFTSYSPDSADAQALVDAMRALDGFNWGYDPQHFAAPEGSYASDPDGPARILEMRAMNQALHSMGLRVVLDVVYNHTASSGLNNNAVLDKLVPGYYQRLNEYSGRIENSTCCENTATEMRMMAKLMNDSLVIFAEQFGFDGFRFDLMGHIPRQAILDARDAVRAVDPDTYFYGEGWNFGEVTDNRRFVQASQLAMAGTEVGTFSDRQREALRSGDLFVANGSLHQQDTARIGLVGNISSFAFEAASGSYLSAHEYQWNGQPAGYADDPADTVNYVSKHDNETLWDKLQLVLPAQLNAQERVRIQAQALSFPLLSQGIPFLHFGSELLRSKSIDRNTYDSGDWFNRVDVSMQDNNWNIGLPRAADNQQNWPAISAASANPNSLVGATAIALSAAMFEEFLQIRTSSPLFSLTDAQQVRQRIKFHNTGPNQTQGLIVMSLDDGIGLVDLDPQLDAIVVVFNSSSHSRQFAGPVADDFILHPLQQLSQDQIVQQASAIAGVVTVPAYTTAVFVKLQQGQQGEGISALPPYAEQTLYLRGDFNNWDTSTPFQYQGNNRYLLQTTLDAGQFEFKIADTHFDMANLGGGFALTLGATQTLYQQGHNLSLSIPQSGDYRFELVADDPISPQLTVTASDPGSIPAPYGSHVLYLRGSLNGWGTSMPLAYVGGGVYEALLTLPAGSHQVKVADADWGASGGANLGGAWQIASGDTVALQPGSNDNLMLILANTGEYRISLNANNLSAPLLSISMP